MKHAPADRIVVIDVLRAIALLGIAITHAEMGFLAGPPPGQDFMQFGALDVAMHRWVGILVESKFFSIFSFLFGLSFAIQLANSGRRGASFEGRFAWRLIVLFLIGMAHQLLFNGDILMIYAALGLLLIPLRQVRSGALLGIALLLVLNVPGLVQGVARVYAPRPAIEQQRANEELGAVFSAGGAALYAAGKSGTLGDVARANYAHGLEMKWYYQLLTGRIWITFGCFLLGVCAGRANLFDGSDAHRRFFRRLLVVAGSAALLSTALMLGYSSTDALAVVLMQFVSGVQKVTLAAAYVAIITLVFWRFSGRALAHLAPLGKMGLTTYLMQSVLLALVFYGFGFALMGEIGSAAAVTIGVALFALQLLMARWWLRRFSMGPVEWLWRSATHFKWQPIAPARA